MTVHAYEPFDYTDGLKLKTGLVNGGFGWAGAWYASNPRDAALVDSAVSFPGLVYPNMSSVGNAVKFWTKSDGNVYQIASRNLTTPITNVNGRTLWISFLVAYEVDNKTPGMILFPGLTTLASGGTIDATPLYVTGTSGVASIAYFESNVIFYPGGYPVPSTHLLMYKIDMHGPGSLVDVSVYYNPVLTDDPSTWGPTFFSNSYYIPTAITGIKWASGRASSSAVSQNYFDEIRFADTPLDAVGLEGSYGGFFPFLKNSY